MISENVQMKLKGDHKKAVVAFAKRTGATTTTEAMRKVIEATPEYKDIHNKRFNSTNQLAEAG